MFFHPVKKSSKFAEPILRDANTGAGQDFTGLAAAVQLPLRVAIFCSAKNIKICGAHFSPVVAQKSERPASNAEVAGEIPSGGANQSPFAQRAEGVFPRPA